jgi:hypothetical protein
MAHDVFISHAHKDKLIAHAICEKLESARIKCWIAERDIAADEDWTEATRNAIGSCRLVVLMLSENANATAHIEREMAHAFYTGHAIIPLRLTDTLPRRDFLFYLGNVRSFDAFGPPAQQHLEALAASINDRLHDRTVPRDAPRTAWRTAAPFRCSESGSDPSTASHSPLSKILRGAGYAASLLALAWLFWFVQRQHERSAPGPESAWQVTGSVPRDSLVSLPQLLARDASTSIPASTADSDWPPPAHTALPTLVQQGLQATPSNIPDQQPAGVSSVPSDVDQNATGDSEGDQVHDNANAKAMQEGPARGMTGREGRRGKSRTKSHARRIQTNEESRVGLIKSRLIALWHQVVTLGNKPTGYRWRN